jgi:hypothetical protein
MGAENSKPAAKGVKALGVVKHRGTLVKKEEAVIGKAEEEKGPSGAIKILKELTAEIKGASPDEELDWGVIKQVMALCDALDEYKQKIVERGFKPKELYQIYPGSSEITGFNLR